MADHFIDNLSDDTLDTIKTQAAGLKWLYEMELLNSPQLINNLKLNILTQDSTIKDVELLIDQNSKAILIYIKLSWWGKVFRKDRIFVSIEDLITQLLPTYRKRVIHERWIFDLAIKKAKQVIGGYNEKSNNANSGNTSSSDIEPQSKSVDELQKASDLLPNQEEQAVDEKESSNEIKQRDLQNDKETQSSS